MSRICTERGFVTDDPWIFEPDESGAGANVKVVQTLGKFLETTENASDTSNALGVLIEPDDDVEALVPHLDRLALVAVMFPAFSDGRGYSHATLLRSRLGFEGEIRAVGDVLIDQIPLMLRCGIDSFMVSDPVALARLEEGRLTGLPRHYQPAAREAVDPKSYSWRRVAAPAA